MKAWIHSHLPAIVAVVLTTAAVAWFPAGCGQRVTPVEVATDEGILLLSNGTDPEELDPHLVSGLPEARILNALLEGLTRLNQETLQPEPAAAQRWTVDPGGLTYTFHLRPEGRWSDGTPVTADDFVFSYQRILTPTLGSPYASMLYVIRGAEAFHSGAQRDFSTVGVRAIDSHTLEIELANPTPYFLSLLSHFAWFPVPRHVVLAHGEIDRRGTGWTRHGRFVGNGPFTLVKWNLGEGVEVKRDPAHWLADRVRLNGIRFLVYEDLNAEERAFRAGQLHITQSVPLGRIAYYRRLPSSPLRIAPYFGTYYLGINTTRPALSDPRVRQALSLALDRKAITSGLLHDTQTPALHFAPPDIDGYTTRFRLREDPAEARRLLAEAGYPDGRGFPRIEILYNTSESHRAIAERIQERWRDILGIEIGLLNQSWGSYLSSRRRGEFDIIRASWIGDYYDPDTFFSVYAAASGNNHTGWTSAIYDDLLAAAASSSDQSERHRLFDQAESLLLRELPIIPIYFYNNTYLVHPSVNNWFANIIDYHSYLDVYLAPQGTTTAPSR